MPRLLHGTYPSHIRYDVYTNLHGVLRWGAISPAMPTWQRRVMASNRDETVGAYLYTDRTLWGRHQVYIDIYTNIILDIAHVPTRRSYTPPTCLSLMNQTQPLAEPMRQIQVTVRLRRGGHHQAEYRRGEGRPHFHHRTSTSRRVMAMHCRSDGHTAPPSTLPPST